MKPGLPPLSPLGTARERWAAEQGLVRSTRFPQDVVTKLAAHDLGQELVYVAWELAELPVGLSAHEQREVFFLALAALVNEQRGSTRLPVRGEGAAYFSGLLDELGATPKEREGIRRLLDGVTTALDAGSTSPAQPPVLAILGRPGDRKPLLLDGDDIYLERLHRAEQRFVGTLAPRHARLAGAGDSEEVVQRAFAAVLVRPPRIGDKPLTLAPEQQEAVLAAARAPLTVITGGPGTGKTSIVVTLLRVLVHMDVPASAIALAAPTGKAAQRMEQSIRRGLEAVGEPDPLDQSLLDGFPVPQTLHRLLGYSPSADRFRHHENNRLAQRVVIVDEGSMIDLRLADVLARAVRDDARLVLLGDADQLPSVDAGAVFRDLVRVGRGVVRLSRSFRMDTADASGQKLAHVARLVNEERGAELFSERAVERRGRPRDVRFDRVEWLDAEHRDAFIARWYEQRVKGLPELERLTRKVYRYGVEGFSEADTRDATELLRHHERSRILCVTRGGRTPTGAIAVNERLHGFALEALTGSTAPQFAPGEPVMVTENDYTRDLYNGDQGVVLRVLSEGAREHHYAAVFPRARGGLAVFPLDALRGRLDLAYATTVHKAQGSEHEVVAFLLPDDDLPLLTRELAYTAVTRSRRSVVIVGKEERLVQAVGRGLVRFAGIGDKLARAAGAEA
jgi:exodeoxyribonuclease V alpha subunit